MRLLQIPFDRLLKTCRIADRYGGVAERLKAAVLKTADGQLSVSSNLTSSAIFYFKSLIIQGFFLPAIYVGPRFGRAFWDEGSAGVMLCLSVKSAPLISLKLATGRLSPIDKTLTLAKHGTRRCSQFFVAAPRIRDSCQHSRPHPAESFGRASFLAASATAVVLQ